MNSTLSRSGPLSSAYKRRPFFEDQFGVVKPVEYVLSKDGKQNLPVHSSSQVIASDFEPERDFIVHDSTAQSNRHSQHRAMSDGNYYKTNELFSVGHPSIAIILYVDDFEICNPLGTSLLRTGGWLVFLHCSDLH